MLFDVRLVAFDAATDGDPADALVRMFGLDHRAARELMRRLPHVVKRGVPEEAAHRLVGALNRIGGRTEIVVSGTAGGTPSVPQALQRPARAQPQVGALPAPAPVASAMIDARRASELAARAPALRLPPEPASLPLPRAAPPQPRDAFGRQHGKDLFRAPSDDDSLEADIGASGQAAGGMLERETLVSAPRLPPAARPPTGPVARNSGTLQATRAAVSQASRAVAAQSVGAVLAPLGSLPQPFLAAQPNPAGFRVVMPPIADAMGDGVPGLDALPPATGATLQMPPANLQRPSGGVLAASPARHSVPGTSPRPTLPTLSMHGPPVEASACIMPGTKLAVWVAWLNAILICAGLTVLSLGILTVVALVVGAVGWLSRRRTLAAVRASALAVGQSQLPELYACAKQFSLRLGLDRVPRLYIVSGMKAGLHAMRDGPELVLMMDELTLLGFLEGPRPEALSCLIAHELARHALGHTSVTRRALQRVNPRLACLDLVTADSAATALVSDHTIVKAALLSLLGVGRLHTYLDHDELDRVATSANREPGFWSTRFGAHDGFVLSRLYHLQRGYV